MKKIRSFQLLSAAMLLLATAWSQAQDRQSPVDFNSAVVERVPMLPKLTATMSSSTTLTVKNTWNPDDMTVNAIPKEFCTVRASVAGGAGTVTVNRKTYTLLQFHFHTPSEHSVDGHRAPMEVHFVCLENGKELGQPDSLLVVGAWIVEGRRDNPGFAKIFSTLPDPNATVTVTGFNLARVFPEARTTFRYPGSLTAPTAVGHGWPSVMDQITSDIFPEIVTWVVSDEPIKLSAGQIDAFKALFDEPEGNSRPVQPIAGRRVLHNRE